MQKQITKKKKMTTRFVEIYKGMRYTEKLVFQRKCLELEYPITINTMNRWIYSLMRPKIDITDRKVAGILRDMGYDVDETTLFVLKPVENQEEDESNEKSK